MKEYLDNLQRIRKNIESFGKIQNLVESGIIDTYDKEIIDFLSTHTINYKGKNDISFLDMFNNDDITNKNAADFSRYLALAFEGKCKLFAGTMHNVFDGKMINYWVETEDSVYDTFLTGKYPKKVYYELFRPTHKQEINLNDDPNYIDYKSSLISITPESDETYLLRKDLLSFFKNRLYLNTHTTPFGYGHDYYLGLGRFPKDEELWKTKSKNVYLKHLDNETYKNKLEEMLKVFKYSIKIENEKVFLYSTSGEKISELIRKSDDSLIENKKYSCFEISEENILFILFTCFIEPEELILIFL